MTGDIPSWNEIPRWADDGQVDKDAGTLWCLGSINVVPGCRSVSVYVDVVDGGEAVPLDLPDVIFGAIQRRYGNGRSR